MANTADSQNEILEIVIDGIKEGKDDSFIYLKMIHRTSLSRAKIKALREKYYYIKKEMAECRQLLGVK